MTARPAGRPERLTASRDILATLRSRARQSGRVAVTHVRHADGPDAATARVAVIASKKVGSAVRRNRAKRLLREAARSVDWAPGLDVVLVARHDTPQSHANDVRAEVALHAATLGATRTEDQPS